MKQKHIRILLAVFVAALSLFCRPAEAQAQTVSVRIETGTLDQAFQQIMKKSNIQLVYDTKEAERFHCEAVSFEGMGVSEILDALLADTPLNYQVKNGIYTIRRELTEQQPVGYLRGRVMDSRGEPIIGASVMIEGTGKGTATDLDGVFEINNVRGSKVPLRISYIGYNTIEKNVQLNSNTTFEMEEIANMMEEVVVTGYQTLSRDRSAGAFSLVDGEAVAERASLTGSVLESLESLSPGLSVNFGEGEEKFTLRGVNSVMGRRNPLYVVDGVPMTGENVELMVNEVDISNITLLKDATAASIWGSQAANGVIVITTRKGRDTNKKLNISYDGSFTYTGRPDYDYLDLMSSDMFMKNAKEIFDPNAYSWNTVTSTNEGLRSGNYPVVMPHELLMYKAASGDISEAELDRQLNDMASRNNRSQIEEYLMKPRFFTKHNVSLLGGGDRYSFYGSMGYEYNQQESRSNFNKYSFNIRQDFELAKWLSLDLTTTVSVVDYDYGLQPGYTDNNRLLPYMMLRDGEGKNLSHADLIMHEDYRHSAEERSRLNFDYVPLDEIRNGFNKRNALNLRLNAGVEMRLAEGLKYEGRFAYLRNNHKSELYNNNNSFVTREELGQFTVEGENGTSPTHYLPTNGGKYVEDNSYELNWTVRNQLAFDRGFNDDEHHITALGGMEIQLSRNTTTTNTLRGYDPQSLIYSSYDEKTLATGIEGAVLPQSQYSFIPNTLNGKMLSKSEPEYRFVSFYANAAYTYLYKYSLNASIRVDQSNLYGTDPSVTFKPVWSAGLAWNIDREEFMEDVDFFNRLSVRMSYGLGGNSPEPGQGGAYNLMQASSNSRYDGVSYRILYPANKLLRWERTRTWNAGVDFSILKGVLSGSFDVYNKYTTDLLNDTPLNPVTGWFAALANMGEISNRGFELSLSSLNIHNPSFTWSTSFALSHNKNKVEKMFVEEPVTASNVIYQRFRAGYAAQSVFAYRWAGLDNNGNPQVYDTEGVPRKLMQEMSDANVGVYMGTSQPPWFGSLTNSFRYKDFDMSFMFIYNFGHKMRNDVNDFFSGRPGRNLHNDFDKRWRQPGDENHTNIPAYIARDAESKSARTIDLYTFADINVLSASYVKLRDVTLSYTVPKRLCEKLSAESVKVRLQAANLFYIAANKEKIDPENQNYQGANSSDVGFGGYRLPHFGATWSMGVNVSF